ncbi:MAG TPA: pyridoxal-phosphate dependent enzyme [Solirubrobacterales bacterium]|nr:pyridoxal-phosphate dependent enzyme [Solirubrobacterales bacterium]
MIPYLHQRFPALAETLPHLVLSERPTPVRELAGLGIWVKEDGAFGSGGWGGNKVRKLEWLIPDARRRGRRSILTFGGLGTNWGLATALYAREHGLETALALVDQPIDDHVRAQLARLEASGARIYRTHTKARTVAMLPWLLARSARGGRPPYLLPAGGSSPVGALGYVEAALEIAAQIEDGALPEPANVVVPVGTGGTAAGLALGFQLAGLRTRVVGVVVNDQLRLGPPVFTRLARRTAKLLERRGARLGPLQLEPGMLDLTRDQIGAGYGHPTEAATRAIALAAEERLALDPVYTAKAMAGLLALREEGRLGGPRCCSCIPTGRDRDL